MKNEISLTRVKSLLKMDLRSKFGSVESFDKKQRAKGFVNVIFAVFVYAAFVALIYFFGNMCVVRAGLGREFLTLATFAAFFVILAVDVGAVIKNLYLSGDNELLLRFPVSGKEILLAKSVYCLMRSVVATMLILLPLYFIFGAAANANVGFYFASLGVALLLCALPYFVANIVALPIIWLMNKIKSKFLLALILSIVALSLAFIVYMSALSSVLQYLTDGNKTLFSPGMIAKYRGIANAAYPFKWYSDVLFSSLTGGATHAFSGSISAVAADSTTSASIGLSFLYIVLLSAALGVSSYFISSKAYYKTVLNGIKNNNSALDTKPKKNRRHTVFGALLRREFLSVERSFNYSFQYLAMAVAAPVMVYYCAKLATTLGSASLGAQIVPGLSLLIVIVFQTVTLSFASTAISREGSAFYLTKTAPVSYAKQIGCKFFLYSAVSVLSVAACCITLGLAYATPKGGYIMKPMDIFAIFWISEIVTLALTSLSLWADIKAPVFNASGDGEIVSANKNVAVSLFFGIIIAAVFGVVAMIFGFIPLKIGSVVLIAGMRDAYVFLLILSLLFLAASVARLVFSSVRRYEKIVN